jgi:branched-chain amino acid transport system ATP-binding protein
MGITTVYSGEMLFNGNKIEGLMPHVVTKLGIAYLPQVNNVFANLKVKENLLMASYILDKDDANGQTAEVIEAFPVLKEYLNKRAGMLSGGERQMLAMAMAMVRRPKVMLFDEPTGSLAPKIAYEVLDTIVDLRDNHGMTIILAEQNARRALEHGDKAILLVSGRVMYDGGSKDLLNHEQLGKVYLGIKDY